MPDALPIPRRRRAAMAALLALATACGGPPDAASAADSPHAARPTPPPPAPRLAPRDSNQAFLRRLADHHEGLVALSDSAQAVLQGADAVQDADRLTRAAKAARQQVRALLAREYADSARPTLPASDRLLIATMAEARGPVADTVFYRQVIAHHREGVRLTEAMLPHLTGQARRMAERVVADERRTIRELAPRAGGA